MGLLLVLIDLMNCEGKVENADWDSGAKERFWECGRVWDLIGCFRG